MKDTLLFTGSYTQPLILGTGELVEGKGDGIVVFRLDGAGKLMRLHATDAPNPTYLALDASKRFLYSVNELKEYAGQPSAAASAYAIDPPSGALRFLNRQPTWGESACNLTLTPNGDYLLCANFSGGSLCMFPIAPDHSIGRAACFFQHYGHGADPERQEMPHVHQAVVDKSGRRVLISDLGLDKLFAYTGDWENGRLIPQAVPAVCTAPGLGPRLCVFNKTGDRLYLLTEMGNVICVYGYDTASGAATLLQTLSTLPPDGAVPSIAACIRLHPNGRLLFASNRGHDSIAVYRVNADGLWALLHIYPSGGNIPRDFDITPDGRFLVVGNQASDELVVFSIDDVSGALTEASRAACGTPTAVCAVDMD